MTDRLSTGLTVLDRNLRGGVPVGSLVALVAPPESQSELLIDAAAAAGPSLYLTASRTPEEVTESLPPSSDGDTTALRYDAAELEAGVDDLLSDLPEEGYAVFDAAEPFEQLEPQTHQSMLDDVSAALRANDAVGLVQCLGTHQDCARGDGRSDARTRCGHSTWFGARSPSRTGST